MKALKTVLTLAAPLALLLSSGIGAAQESGCTTASDCPKGYECTAFASESCAGVACPAGQECPPPPPCEVQTYSQCVATPNGCETNADCDAGMVCFTHTYDRCDPAMAYACAPNTDCPPPPPSTCETTTERSCVPQYMLPCQTASDCGDGFECTPVEACACSGSAGTGSGSAGGGEPTPAPEGTAGAPAVDPITEPPVCTCEASDTSYCQVIELVCSSDTECPDGWTCAASPETTICTVPEGAGGAPECASPSPRSVCTPPYADTVVGVSSEGGAVFASDTTAGSGLGIDKGSAAAPENQNATSGSSGSSSSDSGDSGGCSLAPSRGSHQSGLALALLGLASLFGRRRKH